MIGYVLAAAVVGVAALVGYEKTKSTGSKVRNGDSVYVFADKLLPMSAAPEDSAMIAFFLNGFMANTVKVSGVSVDGGPWGSGSIVGLAPGVKFPLNAVTRIDRNGSIIV